MMKLNSQKRLNEAGELSRSLMKRFAVLAGFDIHHLSSEAAEILRLVRNDSVLVGGAALVALVGASSRDVSPDIDVLADSTGYDEIRKKLIVAGYGEEPNGLGCSFIHPGAGLSVDILWETSRLDHWIVKNPDTLLGVKIIDPAALFMMKCLASRKDGEKDDLNDAKLLLKASPEIENGIQSLRDLVSSEDFEDIEAQLAIFKIELAYTTNGPEKF